jgi:hypothetical protein
MSGARIIDTIKIHEFGSYKFSESDYYKIPEFGFNKIFDIGRGRVGLAGARSA